MLKELPVVNKQAPLKTERREDGALYVHSWFHTIQGEGPFAGSAAFFIRLMGCNLQCPGCDTEYTDTRLLVRSEAIVGLLRLELTEGEILVITGGEPFRQNLTPFINQVRTAFCSLEIQIETNGVLYPGDEFPFADPCLTIVCSPKTGKIHPKLAERVDAYKYVLEAGNVAEDGLPISALRHPLGNYPHVARPPEGWEGPIYVQPMDAKDPEENQRNIEAAVESVLQNPQYTLGVQMHKISGLP